MATKVTAKYLFDDAFGAMTGLAEDRLRGSKRQRVARSPGWRRQMDDPAQLNISPSRRVFITAQRCDRGE
jgi:hypothetical protein